VKYEAKFAKMMNL